MIEKKKKVLPIITLRMALGNLPVAAIGLPLVPNGNDMWVGERRSENFRYDTLDQLGVMFLWLY